MTNVIDVDGSVITIDKRDNKVVVRSATGYVEKDKKLLTVKDTSNGYHIKAHSWEPNQQDILLSIDYATAYYMLHALAVDMGYVVCRPNDVKNVCDRLNQPNTAQADLIPTDVLSLAVKVFGDRDIALTWFNDEIVALGMKRPIDLLSTKDGTNQVVRLLRRISTGVYT